jgi:predicted TPR repeat methyltransferase
MGVSIDTYFVKEGYQINDNAKTFESAEKGEYWTPGRIQSVVNFQFDVYKYAARAVKKNGLKSGLDLGCGPATKARDILLPVLRDLHLIDQPNCKEIAKATIPTANFIGVNLENFNLNLDKRFDIIVCADVLEHLANPLPCLKFAYDHLSSNSIAIFSTPERDILRGPDCTTSPHQAHVREWSEPEFRKLLEFAGFKVVKQKLLPPKRLNPLEDIARLTTFNLIKLKRWTSCQMAICRK